MNWLLSPAGKMLSAALERAECWHIGEYTATYCSDPGFFKRFVPGEMVPSNVALLRLWIANGATAFNGHDPTPKFLGHIERLILWRKFKRMKNLQIVQLLTRM